MPEQSTRYTKEEVLDAIRGEGRWGVPGKITTSSGIVTTVANRLGLSRVTIYKYMDRWPEVREVLEAERVVPLDLAEQRLYDEVNRGNITAIIFLLKTRGKSRGYIERTERVFVNKGSLHELTDDELRAIVED